MQLIRQILSEFKPQGWSQDLVSAGFVEAIQPEGEGVHIHLRFPFAGHSWLDEIKADFDERIRTSCALRHVWWSLVQDVATLARLNQVPAIPGVRNIIAVASGKGGVGKSTTAANLACALQHEGASVGLLDADIYGPSLPLMLGCAGAHPDSPDGKLMEPILAHGIACNSIGFLVPETEAAIWRGPMASKALGQLLHETRWGELDYLVVDLPPGTGDIQLTIAQQVPTTASIVVTTPQDIALSDARKGIAMFNKVNVPVLGVVENMSYHVCSHCGHHEALFGSGGGQKVAEQYHIALLAQLPLHIKVRERMDQGEPLVLFEPGSSLSSNYVALARKVAALLYFSGKAVPGSIYTVSVD